MINWKVVFTPKNIFLVVTAATFVVHLILFFLWIDHPILGLYAFRETQTLISAFWMKNSNIFNYITPVLGYPWEIPFEFPLYQSIVAIVSNIMPMISLDISGRIVSQIFYLAILYPIYRIVFYYTHDIILCLTIFCLYLSSPYYIYYGRIPLIESTALFFCAMFLWRLILLSENKKISNVLLAILFGVIGGVVKITTMPAFIFVGYLHIFVKNFLDKNEKLSFKNFILMSAPVVVTIISVILWTIYSDTIKTKNEIGVKLTSAALYGWSFGNIEQRLNLDNWLKILSRIYNECFGKIAFIVLAFIVPFKLFSIKNNLKYITFAFCCLILYFIQIIIFFNLHLVHDYYQICAHIFMIIMLSFLIIPCDMSIYFRKYIFCITLIITLMFYGFFNVYYPRIINLEINSPHKQIGIEIANKTPKNSSILLFGFDWSSEVQYYAERKGFTDPRWIKHDAQKLISISKNGIGGLPLSAVVVEDKFKDIEVEHFINSIDIKKKSKIYDTTIYYLIDSNE